MSSRPRTPLTTRAILRTRPPRDLASHHAAVGLSRVATWGVDLDVVDLSSSGTAVRRRGALRLHPRVGSAAVLVDGAPAVPLALALVQTAAWSGIVPGVCSIDDALRRERRTTADLDAPARLRHRVVAARSRDIARGLVVPGRGHPHGAG